MHIQKDWFYVGHYNLSCLTPSSDRVAPAFSLMHTFYAPCLKDHYIFAKPLLNRWVILQVNRSCINLSGQLKIQSLHKLFLCPWIEKPILRSSNYGETSYFKLASKCFQIRKIYANSSWCKLQIPGYQYILVWWFLHFGLKSCNHHLIMSLYCRIKCIVISPFQNWIKSNTCMKPLWSIYNRTKRGTRYSVKGAATFRVFA